jgi:Response regulator with putative antiterminator output domain
MSNIIIAYSNLQAAQKIRTVLAASGFTVTGLCGSASQALARASEQEEGGIIVSGYRFPDMTATAMAAMLPSSYAVLLLLTPSQSDVRNATRLPCVNLPVNKEEFIAQLRRLLDAHRHKTADRSAREENRPIEKSAEARALIAQAKELLMQKDYLSEAQAHRYIQKKSMDAGRKMEDTAREILKRQGEDLNRS